MSAGKEAVRADILEARELLRRASRILDRARDKGDESTACWPLQSTASAASELLETINDDLMTVCEGDDPICRVPLVATGKPWREDAGGGFGSRALHALAMCRAAWVGADMNNAPKMERAMAQIARAWLETAGRDRTEVVRAVLSRGLDKGVAARIVAAVQLRMKEGQP